MATKSKSKPATSKTSKTSTKEKKQPDKVHSVTIAKRQEAIEVEPQPKKASSREISVKSCKAPSAPMVVRADRSPTSQQIALRAYQIYERRGFQHGNDVEDWLLAETELRNEQQQSRS
jgi:hypothetical protein